MPKQTIQELKRKIITRPLSEDRKDSEQKIIETIKFNSQDSRASKLLVFMATAASYAEINTAKSIVPNNINDGNTRYSFAHAKTPSDKTHIVTDCLVNAGRITFDYSQLNQENQKKLLDGLLNGITDENKRLCTHKMEKDGSNLIEVKIDPTKNTIHNAQEVVRDTATSVTNTAVQFVGATIGRNLSTNSPTQIQSKESTYGVNIAIGGLDRTNELGKTITDNGYSGTILLYINEDAQGLMLGFEPVEPPVFGDTFASAASNLVANTTKLVSESLKSNVGISSEDNSQKDTDKFKQSHSWVGSANDYTPFNSLYVDNAAYIIKYFNVYGEMPRQKYAGIIIKLTDDNFEEVIATSKEISPSLSEDEIRSKLQLPKADFNTPVSANKSSKSEDILNLINSIQFLKFLVEKDSKKENGLSNLFKFLAKQQIDKEYPIKKQEGLIDAFEEVVRMMINIADSCQQTNDNENEEEDFVEIEKEFNSFTPKTALKNEDKIASILKLIACVEKLKSLNDDADNYLNSMHYEMAQHLFTAISKCAENINEFRPESFDQNILSELINIKDKFNQYYEQSEINEQLSLSIQSKLHLEQVLSDIEKLKLEVEKKQLALDKSLNNTEQSPEKEEEYISLNRSLNEECENLKKRAVNAKQQVDDLTNKLNQANMSSNNLQTLVQKNKIIQKKLQNSNFELKQELHKVTTQLEQEKTELAKLQQQQNKLDELQGSNVELKQELHKVTTQLEQEKTELAKLQQQQQNKLDELQGSNVELKQELQQVTTQLEQKTTELANLQQQDNEAENNNTNAIYFAYQHNNALQNLRKQILNLNSKINGKFAKFNTTGFSKEKTEIENILNKAQEIDNLHTKVNTQEDINSLITKIDGTIKFIENNNKHIKIHRSSYYRVKQALLYLSLTLSGLGLIVLPAHRLMTRKTSKQWLPLQNTDTANKALGVKAALTTIQKGLITEKKRKKIIS